MDTHRWLLWSLECELENGRLYTIPNSTWKGRVVLLVVLASEKRGPGQSKLGNIRVSRSSNWNFENC